MQIFKQPQIFIHTKTVKLCTKALHFWTEVVENLVEM